jgi:hypothetical protein
VLQLRDDLGARVAGPDRDHRQPLLPLGPPLGRVGQHVGAVHLGQQVIAQVPRLDQRLHPVRPLGHARDVELPGDRPGHQDQPVPLQRGGARDRGAVLEHVDPQRAAGDVQVARPAEHQPGARQPLAERDGDVPWLEEPGGHVGEQRAVEHVVGRVDQHQLGRVRR